MNRLAHLGLIALCLSLLAAAGWSEDPPADPAGNVTFKASGLRILGKGYGTGEGALHPMHEEDTGVNLAILATATSGMFIEVMDRQCKVTKFVDDKGTNLLAGEVRYSGPGFSSSPEISKDHKAAMLLVRGGTAPVEGASSIELEGTIEVLMSPSGKAESVTVENAELKLKSTLTAGALVLTITKAGKPDTGKYPLAIQFSCDTPLEAVKSLKFLNGEGKEIKSEEQGGGWQESMGKKTYHRTYWLAQAVEKATIVVESWGDAKTVDVPVKLKVSVGF